MAMVAPVTKEHGLHGTPYDVDSNTDSDGSNKKAELGGAEGRL